MQHDSSGTGSLIYLIIKTEHRRSPAIQTGGGVAPHFKPRLSPEEPRRFRPALEDFPLDLKVWTSPERPGPQKSCHEMPKNDSRLPHLHLMTTCLLRQRRFSILAFRADGSPSDRLTHLQIGLCSQGGRETSGAITKSLQPRLPENLRIRLSLNRRRRTGVPSSSAFFLVRMTRTA